MRFIPKGTNINRDLSTAAARPAPVNADEARRKWNSFDTTPTHHQLLCEQKGSCAYTEFNILTFASEHANVRGAHIEHVAPKDNYPAQTFDYHNLNSLYGHRPNASVGDPFPDNVVTSIYSASLSPDEHPYSLASLVPWLMTAKLFARFTESRFYLSVHQLFDFIKLLLL